MPKFSCSVVLVAYIYIYIYIYICNYINISKDVSYLILFVTVERKKNTMAIKK